MNLTADGLDELLAPITLYPDPVLAVAPYYPGYYGGWHGGYYYNRPAYYHQTNIYINNSNNYYNRFNNNNNLNPNYRPRPAVDLIFLVKKTNGAPMMQAQPRIQKQSRNPRKADCC